MPLEFGTDGVRGLANAELTPELVLALGRAAVRVLGRPFLVGRDTRRSGPMLQAAFSAGAASEGADVVDLGVLPTPGVAFLSARWDVPGAVISASHNPFPDNGVKLFAPGGRKLTDAEEQTLEDELALVVAGSSPGQRPTGAGVGSLDSDAAAVEAYAAHLLASLEGRTLEDLTVVLDCGHGAASVVAPDVVAISGATVHLVGAEPNGTNVNEGCGSTDLGALRTAVVEHGADVGLAFDGDADRVLAVDADGGVVDGDHLIALCALDLRERGRLKDDTVVVTVMTNLGFRRAMEAAGIAVRETPVGDRHVLEALDAGGWSLGGEQSGHLIFRALATTGDGILTGLQVLDLVARARRPLGALAAGAMTRLPQVLRNVRVAARPGAEAIRLLTRAVEAEQAGLGAAGRVLVRPSGTEPVIRVMVEAPTEDEAQDVAARLAAEVVRVLGS
ncbi:MAG TPA: phosphoglucosamine mutase [Acidimicrobiales bacterium]|nr:phosphoglucosamine mutase [Acidimicrobiales bacterium]